MSAPATSDNSKQTLFAMLDRIGIECKRASKLINVFFNVSIYCAIFVFFAHNRILVSYLGEYDFIWIISILVALAFWLKKINELYKDTSSILNDTIGGSDGLLPLKEGIIQSTSRSINYQLKELYECHGNLFKCPLNVNIPTNLELYFAFQKAHPKQSVINALILTDENRQQIDIL